MSKAATGQLSNLSNSHMPHLERFPLQPEAALQGGGVRVGAHHVASKMTVDQVEEYVLLLMEKSDVLGDLYVMRQAEWADRELTRLEACQ